MNPFWSPEVQRRAAQAQPVSAGRATTDDRGRQQGQEEDLEALRLRVMRDAEEIFEREVARLQAARTRDDVSYRTASEGGVVGGLGPPPLHGEGNRPQPPPPPPPPPPRGLDDNKPSAPSHLSEALRNLELPSLPPPGGDLAALTFGDWVTVIGPLMADIAGSAQEWWKDVLQRAESTYTEWLVATPLEKLRLKPSLGEKHVQEQRGLSMLLAALPERNHLGKENVGHGDHVSPSPDISARWDVGERQPAQEPGRSEGGEHVDGGPADVEAVEEMVGEGRGVGGGTTRWLGVADGPEQDCGSSREGWCSSQLSDLLGSPRTSS